MLEAIKSFFLTAPTIAWSIVWVLLAVLVISIMWEKVRWWWLNTRMGLYKISSLSKDLNPAQGHNKWLKSERSLCMEYKNFVRVTSEHAFNEKNKYLVLAGDNGRSNMSKWLWPIIILMVFVEAMGFSYVLAGFTIPGASENVQQYGAYGIAFLISGLLLFSTHFAGEELYKNTKINEAREKWVEDGRSYKLETGTVALSSPQSDDEEFPDYTRRINRIGSSVATYKRSISTAIFVFIIAIGATYVRGQVVEKMYAQDTISQSSQGSQNSNGSDGLDMGEVSLPDSDVSQDIAAQKKAQQDIHDNDLKGAWGTFIVLAFIFAGLQALSVFFGFRWGFAGQNSAQAFKAIGSGRYSTYEEILDEYNHIADKAQSKLEDLQQKIMDRISKTGKSSLQTGNHTFREFMKEQRDLEAQERRDQKDREVKKQKPTSNDALIDRTSELKDNEIDQIINKLQAIENKDEKKTYILSLAKSTQKEVMDKLLAIKEEEKAKVANLEPEWDNVL